jgi:GNAT superfamily N-acetyltransferase
MHPKGRGLKVPVTVLCHGPGAPALRLGLGPGLRPNGAVGQLQRLFRDNSFWARERILSDMRRMLRGSQVAVSLWEGSLLIGFGRATSDGVYRAVLWDVVVDERFHGLGLGKTVVKALLDSAPVARAERVYLMTSNCKGFYEHLGFTEVNNQYLMLRKSSG